METCERGENERRTNDRRITDMAVEFNRREDQRRSGFDRRDMVSGQEVS